MSYIELPAGISLQRAIYIGNYGTEITIALPQTFNVDGTVLDAG